MAQQFKFIGTVTGTDTSHGQSKRGPYQFTLEDDTHQSRQFSSFDKKVEPMVEKVGIGGKWAVEYIEKSWTGTDGAERISHDVVNITSAGPVEIKVEPQQHSGNKEVATLDNGDLVLGTNFGEASFKANAVKQAVENADVTCQHGVAQKVYQAKCGLCIIRQVGFKEIENKDNKSPEELWYLTNLYEDLLTGRFQLTLDATDELVQSAPNL